MKIFDECKIISLLFMVALTCMFCHGVKASIDDLQVKVDKDVKNQLRWDNLQGGEDWLSGPLPEKVKGQYSTKLPAGETILIIQPEGSWLRVMTKNKLAFDKGMLQAEQSVDGELFIKKKFIKAKTDNSLLSNGVLKASRRATLIRLHNVSKELLELSLYRSRLFKNAPPLTYNALAVLPLEEINLQISSGVDISRFWVLPGEMKNKWRVTGPARMQINLRRLMDEQAKPASEVHLSVLMDGKAIQSHELLFKEEYFHAYRIKGDRVSISNEESIYIDIPEGEHELSLGSSSALLVQPYALDKLYWSETNLPEATRWLNIVNKKQSEPVVKTNEVKAEESLNRIESKLLKQARNNAHPESALKVLSEIDGVLKERFNENRWKRDWSENEELHQLYEKIKNRYTRFYPVYPQQKISVENTPTSSGIKQAWFRYLKTRLQFKQTHKPLYLNESFFAARLKQIAEQGFQLLESFKLNYELEPLAQPSELQLLVYKPQSLRGKSSTLATIWLQIDNQEPQRVTFREVNLGDEFKAESVIKSVLDISKNTLARSGKSLINDGALAIVDVASLQLPLNAGSQQIKVWQEGGDELWLAVQQRRGVHYQLSESQYLYQLKQVGGFEFFVQLLEKYKKTQTEANDERINDLENNWYAYIQFLYKNYQNQMLNIKLLELDEPSTIDEAVVEGLIAKAREAENSQQWVLALEYWSALLNKAYAEKQTLALRRIVLSLKRTGQYALARKLQYAIVFSHQSDIIPQAFSQYQLELLLNDYRQENNSDARLSLLSSYFVHRPSKKNLQQFAMALIEEGRSLQGLKLLLLLPESYQIKNVILMSALQSGWMSVFDEQLEKANFSTDEYNKWSGLRALFLGDVTTAKKLFSQIKDKDDELKSWLSILDESLLLHDELGGVELSENSGLNSLVYLKQWQAIQKKENELRHKKWKQERLSVQRYAGQKIISKKFTQLVLPHYLSTPQEPLEMQVAGPVTLRIQVRPVHRLTDTKIQAMDSFYYIEDKHGRNKVLINHNLPDKNWVFPRLSEASSEQWLPGQREVKILNLGPGIHQLKISGKDDLLIRVQRQVSTVPVNVLPELNVESVRALLASSKISAQNDSAKQVEELETNKTHKPIDSNVDVLEQLQSLALQLESDESADKEKQIAMAEKIYSNADSEQAAILASTISRIRANSQWQLLNSFEQSDGVWVRRYQGWQAESPQSRLFQALIEEPQTADELLRNGSSQIISVFNPEKSSLVLQLKSVMPFFVRSQPLKLSYQLDNNKPELIEVGSARQNLHLSLNSGKHSIKITVLEAPVHHRLWMSIHNGDGLSLSVDKSRRYHLASKEQPLIYYLQGPAWLRIDKYVNQKTQTHYQYISAGEQRLTLGVNAQENNAYYRVFKRVENQTVKPAKYITWNLGEVDEKLLKSDLNLPDPHSIQATTLNLTDGWRLGKQQKGTTSLILTNVDQNLIIDELAVTTDQYLESELAYREYLNMTGRWFYIAGVGRIRNEGNPTLGIKSRLRGRFDWNSVDWTLDGRAYAQALMSGTESSAQIRLRLSQTRWLGRRFYHLPKADVFFRWLSAGKNTDTENQRVDRDVYSDYKKDHPSGVRLSESLIYRMYQDAEFYVDGSLLTNANWIELDQYSGRVGARMQWGDARWDLNARKLQFKKDDDRLQARSRDIIQAKFLLEKWIYPRYRAELATAIDHDVKSGDDTIRIQFSVHQSEGRGYRDYSPAETLFRNVRQSNLNWGLNNEVN